MSTEITKDAPATEGCVAAAGYADPVVDAIEKLEGSNGQLEYETRLLLSLAKEAQRTGRMPDLSILKTRPVCPECKCSPPGHRINCKTGNERAKRYQDNLEREYRQSRIGKRQNS